MGFKAGGALAAGAEMETSLAPLQLYLLEGWACLNVAKSKAIKMVVMTWKTNNLQEVVWEDSVQRLAQRARRPGAAKFEELIIQSRSNRVKHIR